MELLQLEYTEETKKYHLFIIKVKTRTFWGKEKIDIIDCARRRDFSQSYKIDGGERLYNNYLNIDDSINAILETKSRCYKKYKV